MVNETILPGVAETAIRTLTSTIAALGGILLLYLIFQSVMVYLNRKKKKELEKINKKLNEIIKLLKKK
ncbi:hypothetical protein K9L16_01090 [Candidatus Pacearchaeota archaeon]|nr:hypothetical protein [Candidatus Pacearchaeota archaeon]